MFRSRFHSGVAQEILNDTGKGHLYDQWLEMLYKSSVTPSGTSKPVTSNIIDEQLAVFEREGVDFGAFSRESERRVEEEFQSSAMPIGF